MGSGSTPLRSRPYPLETDVPDAAADMHALALALDTAPVATQGILSARPTSSVAGNRYMVEGDGTPANNGIEWYDTGSGWVATSYPDLERQGNKGQPNGYADLDSSGHVLLSRLSAIGLSQLAAGVVLEPRTTSSLTIGAVNGDLVISEGAGATVTLPSVTAGARIGVYAYVTPVTITVGATGKILGKGISTAGATSITLGASGAFVVLASDGGNWFIIAGEQDTGWVPLTLGTGVTTDPFVPGGGYTPSARVCGDRATLSGVMRNNSGASITAGTTWATLPTAAIPSATVEYGSGATTTLQVQGNLITTGVSIANGGLFYLDGVTYRL